MKYIAIAIIITFLIDLCLEFIIKITHETTKFKESSKDYQNMIKNIIENDKNIRIVFRCALLIILEFIVVLLYSIYFYNKILIFEIIFLYIIITKIEINKNINLISKNKSTRLDKKNKWYFEKLTISLLLLNIISYFSIKFLVTIF